jgi:CRP-like cAMP-binding protein
MKLPIAFTEPSQHREFSAGSTIFETGDPGDEMFVVQEGEVDIVIDGTVVETVGPDGFFGELALIDRATRAADAVVRTDCKLIAMNQHRFLFMVDEMPFFAIRVMTVMADRLRRATRNNA